MNDSGRLGIVDYDLVDSSNLQRQIIHDEESVGMAKADSAKRSINRLSSHCECVSIKTLLSSSNALQTIKP
jgi:molybdopterin/thiamine biosynthesis adenylyltransferase